MHGLANLVLVLHFLYVLFVVGGLLLIWLGYALSWSWVRRRWIRVLHLAASGVVGLEAVAGIVCPLTVLEDALRNSGNQAGGFLQRWVSALLYWDWPLWVFTALYVAFTVVVATTFVLLPPAPRE
jgi:hypothetical protein